MVNKSGALPGAVATKPLPAWSVHDVIGVEPDTPAFAFNHNFKLLVTFAGPFSAALVTATVKNSEPEKVTPENVRLAPTRVEPAVATASVNVVGSLSISIA